MTQEEGWAAVMAATARHFGKLDVLVNNAGIGLVASLARPGGNLTGFSNISLELTPKRLELLSELVPQPQVIALPFYDEHAIRLSC